MSPVAYQCRACRGTPLPQKWEGPCPRCGGYYRSNRVWVSDGEVAGAEVARIEDGEPISAADLFRAAGPPKKTPTGSDGLDWVFDGGLAQAGACLLCAEQGCGKSTLLLETFRRLALRGVETLYISAEQTLKDLARQFAWLGKFPAKHMMFHAETVRDKIVESIEKSCAAVCAVDSLHAVGEVTDEDGFSMSPGGVAAVSQLGRDLKRLAGEREVFIFAVGHVNNDGSVAGGANVRHMLDGTLVMRRPNQRSPRRTLEFEGKSRFGPVGRVAKFEMVENAGLVDRGRVEVQAEEADEADTGGR